MLNGALVFVSALLLMLALQIETTSDDLWGPKIAPVFLAGSMLALCFVMAVVTFLQKNSKNPEAETGSEAGFQSGDPAPVVKIVGVILLGFFYLYAISLIGYLASTAISLFLILRLFENTNLKKNAVISVVGATVFYLAFIQALGIYDPGLKIIELFYQEI